MMANLKVKSRGPWACFLGAGVCVRVFFCWGLVGGCFVFSCRRFVGFVFFVLVAARWRVAGFPFLCLLVAGPFGGFFLWRVFPSFCLVCVSCSWGSLPFGGWLVGWAECGSGSRV